jgi:pre-mRNA-splicing factor ISY1
MARNAEKANAMLNRFVQAKKDSAAGGAVAVERRPWRASEVNEVAVAEKWRNQVLREISKGVADIQNATLGEHAIRELNDHINKLLREKKHWEKQIKELGGPDYYKSAPRLTDADGRGALGSSGYFYFGAAKDLPGVRELFEQQSAEASKRQRGELYKAIDADYYGYRDDDDGLLERLEKKQQDKLVAAAIADYKRNKRQAAAAGEDGAASRMQDDDDAAAAAGGEQQHKAHVELPSQEEIERIVLEKKKAEVRWHGRSLRRTARRSLLLPAAGLLLAGSLCVGVQVCDGSLWCR